MGLELGLGVRARGSVRARLGLGLARPQHVPLPSMRSERASVGVRGGAFHAAMAAGLASSWPRTLLG